MTKKIVLIDDNIDGNRQKYGGGFVDDGLYQDVLIAIDKLSPTVELDFINNSACVMLHSSLMDYANGKFIDGSNKVASRIRGMQDLGRKIPFVQFSDGDTSDIGDYKNGIIYSLNKRAFYGRLEPFVRHYQKYNEIELKILAFGEKFNTFLVDRAATLLFSKLQDLPDDEKLPASLVNCKEMEQIVAMSEPAISKTYKEIIIGLQMQPITVCEFKQRINNIIENFQDYGQNYCAWE